MRTNHVGAGRLLVVLLSVLPLAGSCTRDAAQGNARGARDAGANGVFNSLVRLGEEGPGAHCASGGVRIEVGMDVNDDGTLSDNEVDQTRYACNGAIGGPGPRGDAGLSGEPGATGTTGGVGLPGGPGTNGEAGPQGAPGTSGEGGPQGEPGPGPDASAFEALVTITKEPIGERCDAGGQRIDVGIDDGAGGGIAWDGVLQPGEIDDTQYVCNGKGGPDLPAIVEGNYTINNSIDVALLQGVTQITGSLVISSTGLHTLDLPNLVSVGNNLQIDLNAQLATVNLPSLQTVGSGSSSLQPVGSICGSAMAGDLIEGGLVLDGNPVLATIDLDALTSVAGDVYINGNDLMTTTAWLSSLQSIGSGFQAQGPALTTLSLPELVTVDTVASGPCKHSVQILDQTLTTISFPLLTHLDSLDIEQAQALQTVNLPSLTSIDASLIIYDSDALQTVTLTNLGSATDLTIYYNDALSDLDLSSLTAVSASIGITHNTSLPQCVVDTIAGQISPAPSSVDTCCNQGTCP